MNACSYLIVLFLAFLIVVIVGWLWRRRPSSAKSSSLLFLRTNSTERMETTESYVSYVVMVYEGVNRQYVGYRRCNDQTMTLTVQSTIDSALYVMTVQPNGNVVFQPIFYTDDNPSNMFLNTSPNASPPCSFTPSISSTVDTWEFRDPRDPSIPLSSISKSISTINSTKLFSSTSQSFVFISYDSVQPVSMSSRIDEASTLDIHIPNVNLPATSLVGIVRYKDLYLNHTSATPIFSSTASSIVWQFQFSGNVLDDGYNTTEMTIQSHPLSMEKNFPSWFLGWDDKSGCRMVQDNTTEWTFEMTSKRILSYGIELLGFLQRNGVYITVNNQNQITTTTTKPTTSPLSILLFNYYLVS